MSTEHQRTLAAVALRQQGAQHPGEHIGNSGMASAGMGDVLAGMLGALLAQGYTGESALVLGTHLHGAAADALVRQNIGPVGMTASEVTDAARRLWNQWL